MTWRKINLGRRTQNGEVHCWHFPRVLPQRSFYEEKWHPCSTFMWNYGVYVSKGLDCARTRLHQRQDRDGNPTPFTPCIVLAVSNLKAQFLKLCCISFTGISGYITINQRRNPWNQSAGMMHWLCRQNCERGEPLPSLLAGHQLFHARSHSQFPHPSNCGPYCILKWEARSWLYFY